MASPRVTRIWVRAGLASLAIALLLPAAAGAAPGDVFVSDLGGFNGRVLKIGPGGGDATVVASAPAPFNPHSLDFTPAGTLLAGDIGATGQVWEIDPRTGGVNTFLGAPAATDAPDAIVAPDGKILISDRKAGPGGTPAVLRVDPVTRAVSVLASAPALDSIVRGLAAKRDGTVFAAGIDKVFRISPAGAVTELVPSNPAFSGANGVALTPDERTLYVAVFDSTPNQIMRVDTTTGAFTQHAIFPDVIDLALRPDGSLFAVDSSDARVWTVGPAGGTPTIFSEDPDLGGGELVGIAVEPERCAGEMPNVVGTTGNDVLTGTPGPDVFVTFAGNDVINGLAGDDIVCGAAGNDLLLGGDGRDTLYGAKGNDRLNGGKGKDRLVGGKGRDRLNGGKGKDVLLGGPGKDLLLGGPGKDRLLGGQGKDRLVGGKGKDICKGGPGADKQVSC